MIKKIPGLNDLVTTTILNKTISEVENKIPVISALVTTAVLDIKIREVETKKPGLSDLVKKQIVTLKYQKSRENTLLLLIIIYLRVTYLTQ